MNRSGHFLIIFTWFCITNSLLAQGVQTFQNIRLYNPTNAGQFITLLPPNTIISYGLTLPAVQGAANTVLLNDGAGNLSFNNGNGIFWRLVGNSGTNPATQFIGTTDAQDVVFRTNNTEKLRILSGGNVGIGTASPSYKLDVNGTGLFRSGNSASSFSSDQLLFSWNSGDQYRHAIKSRHSASSLTDNALDFYLWKQGTDAATTTGTLQTMTLQANNNGSVGIGTTNPMYKLHIHNTLSGSDVFKMTNTTTGSTATDGFDISNPSTSVTDVILNQRENAELRFATNNTQRATFLGTGEFGIATPTPTEGFHYSWKNAIFETDDNQSAMLSGFLGLKNNNDAAYELRFYEPDGCGQNYSAFKAQNQANDLVYTLPSLTPTVNDILSVTNVTGSEVSLSWITPGGAGGGSPVTGTGTSGEIAFWATPTGISSDSRLFWDDATLRLGVGTATPDDMVDIQGNLFITNGATAATELKIAEPNYVGGGNYTSFTTQTQAANVTYTLPDAGPISTTTGTNNYSLSTNTIGNTATLAWQPMWGTSGNSGASTGFLGTTDAQPLAIRTNNTEKVRILTTGEVGIGSITPTQKLEISNGNTLLSNTDNIARELRFAEPSTSGANYTALKAQAQVANVTYTLPAADGTSGQVLSTNGSGSMSWIASTSGTTNTLTNPTNTITSTVNGVVATANAVNTVSNTSAANNLRTTVNGVAGANVNIINSLSNTSSVNSLTTTVNGVAATAVNLVNSVSNTSSANNLRTTVNGVAGANVTMVNSINNLSSGNSLTTTVNGVAATAVPLINSVSNTSSANNLSTTVNGIIGANVTMINSINNLSSGNSLTTTVNGVAATAVSLVNSVSNTSSANNLSTTVNGIIGANVAIVNSISNISSGNNISTTVNGVASANVPIINTNVLSLSSTNLTSTVNGIASTALDLNPVIKSVTWSNTGNSGTSPTTNFIGTTDATDLVFRTNNVENLRIVSSGSVAIGTATPTSLLSVNGTADKIGGGTWGTFSDFRIKRNIQNYEKGLKEILAIRPVTFQYNGKAIYKDDHKTYVGVIAQEMEKILPSTVTTIEKEEFKDLRQYDSSELIYTLINAVKELNTEKQNLKAELESMKAQQEKMLKVMDELKRGVKLEKDK